LVDSSCPDNEDSAIPSKHDLSKCDKRHILGLKPFYPTRLSDGRPIISHPAVVQRYKLKGDTQPMGLNHPNHPCISLKLLLIIKLSGAVRRY